MREGVRGRGRERESERRRSEREREGEGEGVRVRGESGSERRGIQMLEESKMQEHKSSMPLLHYTSSQTLPRGQYLQIISRCS